MYHIHYHVRFALSIKFHKSWNAFQFWDQICPISSQDAQFSNIIFKINKLDLLWVLNFIALGIYFIFGTKFFSNEGIDTCFNINCVLLGRTFDFFRGYCSLPSGYCSLAGGYWWLLLVTGTYYSLVTARYTSYPLLEWTEMYMW